MEVEYADCLNVSLKLFELSFKLYEDSSLLILGKKKSKKAFALQMDYCISQMTILKNRYSEDLSIFKGLYVILWRLYPTTNPNNHCPKWLEVEREYHIPWIYSRSYQELSNRAPCSNSYGVLPLEEVGSS